MTNADSYRSLTLPAKLVALGSLLALNNVGVSAHPVCHSHFLDCQGPICIGVRHERFADHCYDAATDTEWWGDPYLGGCCGSGPITV